MAEKDELENGWGTHYVIPQECTRSGRESGSTDDFKKVVKECVPGYQLEQHHVNGSLANEAALTMATCGNMDLALYGVGCYGGGGGLMLEVSTSQFL